MKTLEEIQKDVLSLNSELNDLEDKIKKSVTTYNKLSEDNNCKNYIIYSEVESLAPNWLPDGPTYIADIAESYSENPGWYSSSWCVNRD